MARYGLVIELELPRIANKFIESNLLFCWSRKLSKRPRVSESHNNPVRQYYFWVSSTQSIFSPPSRPLKSPARPALGKRQKRNTGARGSRDGFRATSRADRTLAENLRSGPRNLALFREYGCARAPMGRSKCTLAEESFCNRRPFLSKRTAARRLARTLVPIRGIRRIAFLSV
jgi:hypothetical protein